MAESWHLKPGEWDRTDLSDKAEMVAFYRAKEQMAMWENYLTETQLEKARLKAGRKK